MSNEKDYFSYVQTIFEKSGHFPSKKSMKTYYLKYVLTPLMLLLIIFVVYDFKFMHNSIFEVATVFESLSSHGHVFGRKLAVMKHAKLLEELYHDRKKFWKYDLFGEKLAKGFRFQMSIRVLIMKGFHFVIFIMFIYFYVNPLISENADLPQACWIPGGTKLSQIVIYILQIMCLTESPLVVNIIDGTFLLMCGEMEIQFSLLKEALNTIKIGKSPTQLHQEKCLHKLKICSQYHQFLIKEHFKMKTVFSEFFLMQFIITIEGLCIEIFVFNKAETKGQFGLAAIYVFAIIMQCCFTFISGSNLENEAETLTEFIYNIDWYNSSNLKIRKHIIFMLMKAQQPLKLTGNGFFDVNRAMLLQILRTGFSISALIRNI